MPFALPLLLLGVDPTSSRSEPAYELRWAAPEPCPARADVATRIDDLLAGGHPHDVHVTAEATVDGKRDRWRLALRISTASGSRTRTVEAETCDELASVAALLVAIAVDPGVVRGEPEAQPEPPPGDAMKAAEPEPPEPEPEPPEPEAKPSESEPEPPSPSPPPAVPVVEPPPSAPTAEAPRRTLHGGATARIGLSMGVLPSIAPVLRVGAGPWWRLLGVQVSVVHRLPRRVTDGRAELWTLAADLRGCVAPRTRDVRFPLCAGVEVGAIAGRSFGVTDPGRGRAPWLALGTGGGVVAMIGRRVGIAIDAGLVIPVIRAGFGIEGIGELHRVGAVGMDANVGVEVLFP